MVKNILIVIIITTLALYSFYRRYFHLTPTNSISISIKDHHYTLEIARTPAQKTIGLMNRPSLCANCGMIFVNKSASPQIFWMKNTLIPLDIIFLDPQGKVINIESATPEPGVADLKLKLYRSTAPAQYVIELNASDSQKLGLSPGDTISLSALQAL